MKKRSYIIAITSILLVAIVPYFLSSSGILPLTSMDTNNGTVFLKTSHSSQAGYIPGEFSVSAIGKSSYTIKIVSPTGINAIEPQLELVYTNTTTNGILGVGWNLNGLSMITRVGKSIPQDGIKKGVTLTKLDRFAINGQRLIAYKDYEGNLLTTRTAKDNAYGKNGTEYRTEIETWMRIYSQGNCGGGPCSFTAYGKDGSVLEFANSDNAKFKGAKSDVIKAWGINKITDRNNNYITISYLQNADFGEIYPAKINYTGNIKTQLNPQRLIVFEYESRSDSIVNFLAGVQFSCKKRLKKISTFIDQDGDGKEIDSKKNLVTTYRIDYEYGLSTGRSIINAIQVCDASGVCMAPTSFKWSSANPLAPFSDTLVPLPDGFSEVLSKDATKVKADFNGDGKMDIALLEYNSTIIPMLLSNAAGGFDYIKTPTPSGFSEYLKDPQTKPFATDYNGDGLTDIFFFKDSENNIPILYAKGDGSFGGIKIKLPSGYNERINKMDVDKIIGDFNGDGLPDFAGFKTGYTDVPIISMQPDGSFKGILAKVPSEFQEHINPMGATHQAGDFNGDGLIDIAVFNEGYKSIPLLFSNGALGFDVIINRIPSDVSEHVNAHNAKQYLGDFNGDGLTDISVFINGALNIPILFSKGKGTFLSSKIPLPIGATDHITSSNVQQVLGDINGDGITDIIAFSTDAKTVPTLLSTSQNQFIYKAFPIPNKVAKVINEQGVERILADFNGDGLLDIAAIKRGFKSLPVLIANKFNSNNNKPDLLLEINNGIGAVIKIDYKPITDISVYSRSDSPISYPLMQTQFPEFVVAHYDQIENPKMPSTRLNYDFKYSGAIIDHFRGFRGFQNKFTTDFQNGTYNKEHYLVEFPYQGIRDQRVLMNAKDTSMLLQVINDKYDYKENHSTRVIHLWKSANELHHYTNGYYNYTVKKEFIYDQDHRFLLQVNDLGDISDPLDNVITYHQYLTYNENSPTWWKSFFPIAKKTKKDTIKTVNWSIWVNDDFTWKKTQYDSKMNIVQNQFYVDTDGLDNSGWTEQSFQFDQYGNNTAITVRSNNSKIESATTSIVIDPVFHTFPIKTIYPKNNDSISLISFSVFDPRFGEKIQETDVNGHIIYNIPNSGIDGFGQILKSQTIAPDNENLVTAAQFKYTNSNQTGYQVNYSAPTSWSSLSSPDSSWLYENSFIDGFGRNTGINTNGYTPGVNHFSAIEYDLQGRISKQFVPMYSSGSQSITTKNAFYYLQEYDQYGRLTKLSAPTTDSLVSHTLTKEFIRNDVDDRIVYIKTRSPENDNLWVYYRKKYNTKGRLIEKSGPYSSIGTEGPNFGKETFLYNAQNQLIEIIDPSGQKRVLKYNSLGSLIFEHDAETDATRYVFNKNNLMISRIDAFGSINWTYDNLDRVVDKITKTEDGSVDTAFLYIYDNDSISTNSMGLLSKTIGENFSYSYNYDNRGNLTSHIIELSELKQPFIQHFSYDAANRLTLSIYPDGSKINYTYNHGNKLATTIFDGDTLASYSNYDALGAVGNIEYGNGIVSSMNYDLWGRLIDSKTEKGAYELYQSKYTWSKANKLRKIDDTRDVVEVSLNQYFQYSLAGRLINAKGSYGEETFTYTPSGDRLTYNNHTYAYNPEKRHQLVDVKQYGRSISTYSYSNDGALSHKKVILEEQNSEIGFDYQFSGNGDLTQVTSAAHTINSFTYDDQGNRLSKKEADGTIIYYVSSFFEVTQLPNATLLYTKYVHDEQGVLYAETTEASKIDILSKLSIGTNTTHLEKQGGSIFITITDLYQYLSYLLLVLIGGIFLWVFRYIYQSRQQKQTKEPSSWRMLQWGVMMSTTLLFINPTYGNVPSGENGSSVPINNQKRFYHHNLIGSTTLITDENGGLTNSIIYKPFGEIDKENSTGLDNFRKKFTGKELDVALDLYYFGSRYYDAHLGRFISPDPARQYSSTYMYSNGDPLAGKDENGEEFIAIGVLVTAISIIKTSTAVVASAHVATHFANGNFNPLNWKLHSINTWVGFISDVAAVAAIISSGGVAAPVFSGISTGIDITISAYSFANNPNLMEGLNLAKNVAIPSLKALSRLPKVKRLVEKTGDNMKTLFLKKDYTSHIELASEKNRSSFFSKITKTAKRVKVTYTIASRVLRNDGNKKKRSAQNKTEEKRLQQTIDSNTSINQKTSTSRTWNNNVKMRNSQFNSDNDGPRHQ